jgi:uncharacterized membrane protein YuzA (DUF378 family)
LDQGRADNWSKGAFVWILDFSTLLLVLAAGLYLGFLGISGYPPAFAGDEVTHWFYLAAGVAGIWQLTRQKFF